MSAQAVSYARRRWIVVVTRRARALYRRAFFDRVLVRRACVLGQRVGMMRCRNEAFVLGDRMRDRDRAAVWRCWESRALRCGRWCGRDCHWGVDSRSLRFDCACACVCAWLELERWELRRRISSVSSVGSWAGGARFVGLEGGWVVVGDISRFWRAVVRIAAFMARVWDILRALCLCLC